jgi:trigger factor
MAIENRCRKNGGANGNVEKWRKKRAKLTVNVTPEAFAAAIQQAYFKTAKRYNIPGFRKGKAPKKVIENMYGEGVFYEDAFELVWATVRRGACRAQSDRRG